MHPSHPRRDDSPRTTCAAEFAAGVRPESLGVEHPLNGVAAALRLRIEALSEGIAALRAAVIREKAAEAVEWAARGALRRQYERNYLRARGEFGRKIAERLFPAYPPHIATRHDAPREPKAA